MGDRLPSARENPGLTWDSIWGGGEGLDFFLPFFSFLLLLHRRRKLYYYVGKAWGGGGGSSSVWGGSFPCAPLISANIVHITSSIASPHLAGIFCRVYFRFILFKKEPGRESLFSFQTSKLQLVCKYRIHAKGEAAQ